MYHFSKLDAVGSHMLLIHWSICDQDLNVVITNTSSLYFEVLCVPECFVVFFPQDILLWSHFASKQSVQDG